MPQLPLRKTFYEQLKSVFAIVDVETVQPYLELLLLRMFDEVVALSNDESLKEYFLFTSFFLSQADFKVIEIFRSGTGKELCRKMFKIIEG